MRKASNGDLLTEIKCVRYDYCRYKEPFHGYVPLKRQIAAESRGKETKYCSDECRHAFHEGQRRANAAAKKKPTRRKKKRAV